MVSIGAYNGVIVIHVSEGATALTQTLSIEAANTMAKMLVDAVKEVKKTTAKKGK